MYVLLLQSVDSYRNLPNLGQPIQINIAQNVQLYTKREAKTLF